MGYTSTLQKSKVAPKYNAQEHSWTQSILKSDLIMI